MQTMLFKGVQLCILGLLTASYVYANPFAGLTFLTEEYPPYNYSENMQLKGISVELLQKASNNHTQPDQIEIWPWPRAYVQAQRGPNTVLFATTRTPSRESLFKWVGPITKTEIVVLTQNDSPFQNLQELINAGGEIGVIRDDIGEILSLESGVPAKQLRRVSAPKNIAKMLTKYRLQGWAYERNVALWHLKALQQPASNFRVLATLKQAELYFAVSLDVSNQRIQEMNAAVEKARKTTP